MLPLRFLFVRFLVLSIVDWPIRGNKTSNLNVHINPNTTSFYAMEPKSAINATFNFLGPSAFYALRFIPAALWKEFDSDVISTSLLNHSLVQSLHLANLTALSNRTEDQVLPLALWADRSVLVFSIRHLGLRKLYKKTGNCARVRMCALPWELATTAVLMSTGFASMEFLCNTPLKQVHQDCLSEADSYEPLLMPLAHGLAIEVDGLGTNAAKYEPNLGFVASAGYSLPAGQFFCPKGLFACLPPSYTHPIANRSWSQRICLPESLRCDGVVNCPVGDADERDCSNPPPVEFDSVPVDEWELFHTYLQTINPVRLVYEAGHPELLTVSGARLSLLNISVMVLLVLLLLLIVAFYYVRRRRHLSSGSTIMYRERKRQRTHRSFSLARPGSYNRPSLVGDQEDAKEWITRSSTHEPTDCLKDSSYPVKTSHQSTVSTGPPLAKPERYSQSDENSITDSDSFGVCNATR